MSIVRDRDAKQGFSGGTAIVVLVIVVVIAALAYKLWWVPSHQVQPSGVQVTAPAPPSPGGPPMPPAPSGR